MTLMNNNATANHHHSGPEAQFNPSPGEGRGHKPSGTPAREGRSYIGKYVPVKPFEGGLKAVSNPKMVTKTVESIVKMLKPKPKFPINIVTDKIGTCNVKRVFTDGDSVPEMKGLQVVKCTNEGVDVLIPDDKKDMIPAIQWAIAMPRFWFSVIHKVAGLPLPKDRLEALKEESKESTMSPLSILKERESQPEFLPCTELSLPALKSKVMEFWPGAASAYPKQPQRIFTAYEITLLQSALKKDVFYLMIRNPVLWLPIRHDQMASLATEFSTVGSKLHSLVAEIEVGGSPLSETTIQNDREMQDLSEEALQVIQLAERERSMTESSDDSFSEDENLVLHEVPAGGISSEFHDDVQEAFIHEAQAEDGNHEAEVEETILLNALHDAEKKQKKSESHNEPTPLPTFENTDVFVRKTRKTKSANVKVLEFYEADAGEHADDEITDHSISKRFSSRRERKNKSDKETGRQRGYSDRGNKMRNAPKMEMRPRREKPKKEYAPERQTNQRSSGKEKLPERQTNQRSSGKEMSPKKKSHPEKETLSHSTYPPPDANSTSKTKWSRCWRKVQLLVRKTGEPKAVMQPAKSVTNEAKEKTKGTCRKKFAWFSKVKAKTSFKDEIAKIWSKKNDAAPLDGEKKTSNKMSADVDEPNGSTIRGRPTDCYRETKTHFPPEGGEGPKEYAFSVGTLDYRMSFFEEDDDALYEDKKGSTEPRFVEWCRQKGRDPTGGIPKETPNRGPFGKLRAFVRNIKKRAADTKKGKSLRKLSEEELASKEALVLSNEWRKKHYPPESQKDKDDWVPNHCSRMNQLTSHFEMRRKEIENPKACNERKKKKKARFAWKMVEYGPAPKEWPDLPLKESTE